MTKFDVLSFVLKHIAAVACAVVVGYELGFPWGAVFWAVQINLIDICYQLTIKGKT